MDKINQSVTQLIFSIKAILWDAFGCLNVYYGIIWLNFDFCIMMWNDMHYNCMEY